MHQRCTYHSKDVISHFFLLLHNIQPKANQKKNKLLKSCCGLKLNFSTFPIAKFQLSTNKSSICSVTNLSLFEIMSSIYMFIWWGPGFVCFSGKLLSTMVLMALWKKEKNFVVVVCIKKQFVACGHLFPLQLSVYIRYKIYKTNVAKYVGLYESVSTFLCLCNFSSMILSSMNKGLVN